jgi:Cytochrome P460
MRKAGFLLLMTPLIVATVASAYAQSVSPVPYPEGYRGWTHVKSMIIEKGHSLFDAFGGIHHIYANPAAMRGYRGGKFPNGSVIAFDLLETTKTADNAIVEGSRKVLGVMHKDSGKYKATGGWGFEGFKGDSKSERAVGAKMTEACFGCHAAQKSTDYVFSAYRK